MKRIFLILILLSALSTKAQDQIMKISGGIKLGTGISILKQESAGEPGYLKKPSPLPVLVIGGRITGPVTKKMFFITELCMGAKGGILTRSSGDSSYYTPIYNTRISAHPLSILFNLAYRTRAKDNTFFLGGGMALDLQRGNVARKKVTGGLNLLAGYRFFPGFSAEINCKYDLTSNQLLNGVSYSSWSSTVIALSLAYDF